MPSNLPSPHGISPQQDLTLTEQALPFSNRRIQTLQAMEHALTSSSKLLSDARQEFYEATSCAGDGVKSQIHRGGRLVDEALQSLSGIESLVDVNPNQVIHTSTSITRMINEIKRIHSVSRLLATAPNDRHYPRALAGLANKCDHMSKELVNFVDEEIKKAQREMSSTPSETSGKPIA